MSGHESFAFLTPPGKAVPHAPDEEIPEPIAPPVTKEPGVITPPENFAVVEPGLYRSGLPNPKNFAYVRSLRLRHVIILSPERPMRNTINFFENQGIKVSHTGIQGWRSQSSWKPIAEEVVKESLEIILRSTNHPTLVCDVGGVHLVGMVIGCLRRLQNWNLNSVVNEYRSFAGPKTRYNNEQFMELFDVDLVIIPPNPPIWFSEQQTVDDVEKDGQRRLFDEGMMDNSGTLLRCDGVPRYIVHFFSSEGPLNSETGGRTPRIQTL